MDRLITLLVTLCVAAGLMFAWDRHPPIDIRLPIPILHPHIRLPDSLATQRDKAAAALGPCRQNAATLQALLRAQNLALEASRVDSAAIERGIARGAQAAGKAAQASILRAQRTLAVNTDGPASCAAYDAVDAAVVEGRR